MPFGGFDILYGRLKLRPEMLQFVIAPAGIDPTDFIERIKRAVGGRLRGLTAGSPRD